MDYSDDSSDPSSKPQHPRHPDLESLCSRQHDEIESLKTLLQAKDQELESLNRILQKYANIIPELKTVRKTPGVESTFDKSEGDFWDSHEEAAAQVNFDEIASKGLWIMSSVQQTNGLNDYTRLARNKGRVDRKKAESVPLEEKQGRRGLKLGELIRPAGPVRSLAKRSTDIPVQAAEKPTKNPHRLKDPQPPTHRKAVSLLSRLR
jgi:hypothetical protein